MIPSTGVKSTDDTDNKTIGDLSPGDAKEVKFSFAVRRDFTGQEIPLTIKLREERAKAEASERITLPVHAYLSPPRVVELPPKPPEPDTKPPEPQPGSDVDVYIQNFKPVPEDQTKWAVVIGIEHYRKAPPVSFARNDALAVREYLRKLFGVPKENTFFRLNNEATLGEIQGILEGDLPQRLAAAKEGIVYVYFAGHGIASKDDRQPYLLPHDGDPESRQVTGYAQSHLYDVLGQLKASQVYVFLDACFSGGTRTEETLLPDARPGVLRPIDPVLASKTLLVLAAAKGNQVSNELRDQQHGLFTYYLLKGLMKDADSNKDKRVQAWELATYLQTQVSQKSRSLFGQQRNQDPEVRPTGLEDRRNWIIR